MLLLAISPRYRCRIFLQFSPGTVNGHTSDKTLEAFEFPGTTGSSDPEKMQHRATVRVDFARNRTKTPDGPTPTIGEGLCPLKGPESPRKPFGGMRYADRKEKVTWLARLKELGGISWRAGL